MIGVPPYHVEQDAFRRGIIAIFTRQVLQSSHKAKVMGDSFSQDGHNSQPMSEETEDIVEQGNDDLDIHTASVGVFFQEPVKKFKKILRNVIQNFEHLTTSASKSRRSHRVELSTAQAKKQITWQSQGRFEPVQTRKAILPSFELYRKDDEFPENDWTRVG